ncbi:MAG: hypothetical protein U0793_16725 [Gemmataceae bacterium]
MKKATILGISILALCSLFASEGDACRSRRSCGWCSCCADCCCYYVSYPIVNVNGPFPTLLREAAVGRGVAAQFDVHLIPPFPVDKIEVHVKGKGHMSYHGWSKHVVNPCLLGSPTRYTIYLCPVTPGECHVDVNVYFDDGSTKTVPYAFLIRA